MNKDQLKKTKYYYVRLRPIAQRANENGPLPEIDDDWLIQDVTDKGVTLLNPRTRHEQLIPFDNIREFMSDAGRDNGTMKHGFLRLKSQLTLKGRDVLMEPAWD